MESKQLIKWHAVELYRLLLQDPNDAMTAPVAAELETVFLNSEPFKSIEAKPPESTM